MTHLDHDLYSSYLVEHYLAASSGVQTFQAAVSTWEGTDVGATLQEMQQTIHEERDTLRTLIEGLGYQVGSVKEATAAAARVAGRLNPLNPLRSREQSFAQIELETLTGIVRMKRCMWETLLELTSIDPRLDRDHLEQLRDSARSQEDQLAALLLGTATERFSAGSADEGPA
ncbi:MAG: hypothetical protein Q4G40_01840 [Brachybacterium sp.]|nr:hypothetical protein [Brachybacterium sp.]